MEKPSTIFTSLNFEGLYGLPSDYWEVRCTYTENLRVNAKNQRLEGVEVGSNFGAGIRVLMNGSWGMASTTKPESELLRTADRALKLAKVMHYHFPSKKVSLAPVPYVRKNIDEKVELPEVEEMAEVVLECEKNMNDLPLSSTQTFLSCTLVHKLLVTSEGSYITQRYFRSFLQTSAVAKKGERVEESSRRDVNFRFEHDTSIAKNAAESAIRMLEAKTCPSGTLPVVLDPELVAVFIHEALGHMVEADLVLEGGSILASHLGEKIASDEVTIVDDGNAPGFGRMYFDDEGVKAKATTIVEKGILKTFLHTRETAALMHTQPTGNARAQSYEYFPLPRMTNTSLLPGSYTLEELFKEAKKGVYLKGSRGGECNPVNGTFQFAAKEGYLIENGEVTQPLRNAGISGSTLAMLKEIKAIGSDYVINAPGYCGKKSQSVAVDGGAPHILAIVRVGGIK